jgi:hypothetical protein
VSDDVVPTGRPRVLVIGGRLKHVRKARALGLDVVHIQFPDQFDRGHWPYVDQALLLDYGDIDRLLPLVRALHEAYPFQTAVSLSELGLLPAARINEALGIGGESVATVELLLDKWRMRRHLAARGISPVASAVGRTTHDVREFVQAHGLPIVVESHNRIGGDRINELTVLAYGVDMERYALGAGFGVLEPLTWNEDKVGHVIARAATATEAIANGRRLAAAIHVRTEPVA